MRESAVMLELEVSQDDHGIGVRIAKFSKCPNLFRTEFQRPSQLPKVITPEPLIVRGRVKNCWKTKEVSYWGVLEMVLDFESKVKVSQIIQFCQHRNAAA
jgi:hypothetical protein